MSKFIEVSNIVSSEQSQKILINIDHVFRIMPEYPGCRISFNTPGASTYYSIIVIENYDEITSLIRQCEQ